MEDIDNGTLTEKEVLEKLKKVPCQFLGYDFLNKRFYFRGEYDNCRVQGYINLKTFLNNPNGVLYMLHVFQRYYVKDFDGYKIYGYKDKIETVEDHLWIRVFEKVNWINPPLPC